MILSWTFLLIEGLSRAAAVTTAGDGPLWQQDPIVRDGWYYGYPSEEPIIIFCNDTNPIECPVVPPKAKTFAQLIGTVIKGEYWMTMLLDLEPPTSIGIDYALELLDFGVVIEGDVNISTVGEPALMASMDVIWLSEGIILSSYPTGEWQTIRFNFYNHSGPVKNINIQYLVNNYIGSPIRVTFRGVALYWY